MGTSRPDSEGNGQGGTTLLGAVRELRAGARNLAAATKPTTSRSTHPAPRADDLPVLLVHGYGGHKSQWFRVERALATAGFRDVRTFEYDSMTSTIPAIAAQLTRAVQQLLAETGAPEVHLIGHSLGGVIIRYAVTMTGLDPLVRTAVTVASPHGGCRLAHFGFGPAVAQIRPGAATLRRLESVSHPQHTRWVAFYSDADAVVPAERARIRPRALAATNIRVRGEGHLSILHSSRLTATLIEQLRSDEVTLSAAA